MPDFFQIVNGCSVHSDIPLAGTCHLTWRPYLICYLWKFDTLRVCEWVWMCVCVCGSKKSNRLDRCPTVSSRLAGCIPAQTDGRSIVNTLLCVLVGDANPSHFFLEPHSCCLFFPVLRHKELHGTTSRGMTSREFQYSEPRCARLTRSL